MLFESGQRYKFESNSQLVGDSNAISLRCLNQVKDTSLKAIHNSFAVQLLAGAAV